MRTKIKKPKALTKYHSPNKIDFGSLETVERRFWPYGNFSHRREGRDFRYHDGLNRNLGTIKMKTLIFQGRNDLRLSPLFKKGKKCEVYCY
jgi:hypothetical protein